MELDRRAGRAFFEVGLLPEPAVAKRAYLTTPAGLGHEALAEGGQLHVPRQLVVGIPSRPEVALGPVDGCAALRREARRLVHLLSRRIEHRRPFAEEAVGVERLLEGARDGALGHVVTRHVDPLAVEASIVV